MTMRLGRSRSPMRTGAKSGWLWTDRGIEAGPSRLLSGEGEDRLRPPRAVATDFRYLLCIRYMDRPNPAAARERRRYAVATSESSGVDQDDRASAARRKSATRWSTAARPAARVAGPMGK